MGVLTFLALVIVGANAQVALPKAYINITSNFGRLTAAWNAWSWVPPRGVNVTGFFVDAVPLNETWPFDEPLTSQTGWLYDDGSSTTSFSSSLSSLSYGGGNLSFTLIGSHGA